MIWMNVGVLGECSMWVLELKDMCVEQLEQ